MGGGLESDLDPIGWVSKQTIESIGKEPIGSVSTVSPKRVKVVGLKPNHTQRAQPIHKFPRGVQGQKLVGQTNGASYMGKGLIVPRVTFILAKT